MLKSFKNAKIAAEFLFFIKKEKKFWLIPLIFIFLGLGILIVFSESSAIAPFIYSLF